MPCFLPSISPLPPQLKKRSQPHSTILVSFHTSIDHAEPELRLRQKAINHGSPRKRTVGMGNVVSGVQIRRRLPAVEERLTRPRRLVRELPDLDAGRLHRLIRSGDLAPCFDPAEDAGDGQAEECPICFYFYPSLNRSKCCGKGICTECFLQLMPSKTSNAVHAAALSAKSSFTQLNTEALTQQVRRKLNKRENKTSMRLN
ncbi:uncharacterized protein [Setaria viridis]|uniref:uncharacterized protein isoform X2 n=1 Tax=Setaria viridis TaxID=4556 RepID=UPI001493DD84|nr:uncharacterized protein LOC117851963 isoform X2 [Setaria viridis]